jgi:hypothetical protein
MEKAEALIDDFISRLDGESGSPSSLVREHLEAARSTLLNSMPDEYALNLKLAKDALAEIPDGDLRSRISRFIDDQGVSK